MGESLEKNIRANSTSSCRFERHASDLFEWHLWACGVRDRLNEAWKKGRVTFAYQSVVGRDGSLFYHECLLRAADPLGLPLHPADFVPVMEQFDEIGWLDRFAMLQALAKLEAMRRGVLGLNMSGQSLGNRAWMAETIELLSARRVLAERLIVEVAGIGANFNLAVAAESVAKMRALGVRVALDNFGIGALSCDDLRALDVDIVKFDRRLVDSVCEDEATRDHLAALTESALGQGMLTVAEGVSNLAQICVLGGIGIRFFQGFGISKPQVSPMTDHIGPSYFALWPVPNPDVTAPDRRSNPESSR